MIRRGMLVVSAALALLAGACATVQDTPAGFTTVTIEKLVHFSSPDGADVMAAPGRYHVDSIEEVKLQLTPAGSAAGTSPLIVAAMALPHEEPIESRVALSVPNGEDEHHVVLLLPDGKGLDAGGTYSGVRTRATVPLAYSTVKQYAISQPFYAKLLPQGPDLTIKSVTGVPLNAPALDSSSPFGLPVRYSAVVIIRNSGSADVYVPVAAPILGGASYIPNRGDPVTSNSPISIKPGETRTYAIEAVSTCPRTTPQIQLKVDPLNRVAEWSESNNGWSINLAAPTLSGTPDLVVTRIWFTPEQPRKFDQVTTNWEIKNVGSGSALLCSGDSESTVIIVGTDKGGGISAQTKFLNPGETISRTQIQFSPGQLQPGTYTVTATVDPGNAIGESNETNNNMTATLTIAP